MKTITRHYAARTPLRTLSILSAILVPVTALASATVAVPGDSTYVRPNSTLAGPTSADTYMTVAVILPLGDAAGAASFASHVSTPGDPLFRHPITPAQFAARFGANPDHYAAVIAWAKASGLTLGESFSARTVLPVSGTTATLEAALGLKFNNYTDSTGATYFAASQPARLPVAVAGMVRGVLGLSSANHFVPLVRIKPAGVVSQSTGTGANGAFAAADLRTAYAIPSQVLPARTQVMAVFEQGGFFASDVAAYVAANKLPAIPVVPRSVDGYGSGVDDPTVELEAVLDIDMEMAMNPMAKKIVVYEDGVGSFPVALLDSLSAMATDNIAKSIGVSYGIDEAQQSATAIAAENEVLTQLAAQGQAVFVSAGDNGAYGRESNGLNVEDPASQPFVTSVGGTTLFTNSQQQRLYEETWNNLGIGAGATGGGISTLWAAPDYQLQYGTAVMTTNGGSATMRNVPDVAAVGNPLTGVAVYASTYGGWITIGGTSVSAPLWAGTYSLANASSEALGFGPAGFANPTIYVLGNGGGIFQPDFIDVQVGSNGFVPEFPNAPGYSAGYGYDNVTGWGTMFGPTTIADVAVAPSFGNTNPPPPATHLKGSATSTSVTVHWGLAKGAGGYALEAANTQTGLRLPNTVVHTPAITYSGLTPNTIYEVVVISISAGGQAYSAPVFVKTLN